MARPLSSSTARATMQATSTEELVVAIDSQLATETRRAKRRTLSQARLGGKAKRLRW